MKRIITFALAAAASGWGGPALAANPPAGKTTLVQKLFAPPAPKPAGPSARTPNRPITVSAPLAPDQLADAVRAEQDAYLRRVSVCTELRRIALERGDDATVRQADELEKQAGALYNARVAALGVSRAKAPLPEPSTSAVAARSAADRLLAPPAPVPGTATAQVREVKP
jgi:hypothetical protein